jgi:hypothetical protein
VAVGTLYERSHIKLHKWVLATHLLAASRKGMSAHQLHRMLGVTYKTAWFMGHRIRAGMATKPEEGLGGEGQSSRPTKRTSAINVLALYRSCVPATGPQVAESRVVEPVGRRFSLCRAGLDPAIQVATG